MSARTGVVLLAHGSPDMRHARDLSQLRRAVAGRLGSSHLVAVAYLDHHEPAASTTARALLAAGVDTALVVPVFTSHAYHMRVDVPAALTAMAAAGLDATQAQPGLAGNPTLVNAALSGVTGPNQAVVLYAAGSSDRSAGIRLAHQVAGARRIARAAFLTGGPDLAHALGLISDHWALRDPVVVPFVIADGIIRDRMAERATAHGLALAPGALAGNAAVASLIVQEVLAQHDSSSGSRQVRSAG